MRRYCRYLRAIVSLPRFCCYRRIAPERIGRAQQDFFRKEAATENSVLKVDFIETATEQRWILQGRLIAPWIRELRTSWKNKHRRDERRTRIVDLNEITFIDKSGERLLRLLVSDGAQCIASGGYTKHVVDRLAARARGRLLSRFAIFLFVVLLAGLVCAITAKASKHTVAPRCVVV